MEAQRLIFSMNDLVEAITSCLETFIVSGASKAKRIWWRGQADTQWFLLPSVYRPKQNYTLEREQERIFRFRQRARTRHSTCPADNQVDSWLFLMQHYGLPTRLLDWTESPLTALFFAVSENEELRYRPAALWALSPELLNEQQAGSRSILLPTTPSSFPLFQEPFGESQQHLDRVIAVAAPEIDVRMLLQASAFTIHGSQTPLDEVPQCERFLVKFEIAVEQKPFWRELLGLLGVRESSLFPDLAHLAKELVAND